MTPRFRAWFKDDLMGTDNPKPRMIYDIQNSYDYGITIKNNKRCVGDNESCFGDYLNNKHYVVMRSTGIKDEKGKEIFEGDIIHYCYYNYKFGIGFVVWDENLLRFRVQHSNDYQIDLEHYGQIGEKNFGNKILGNIYENPESMVQKRKTVQVSLHQIKSWAWRNGYKAKTLLPHYPENMFEKESCTRQGKRFSLILEAHNLGNNNWDITGCHLHISSNDKEASIEANRQVEHEIERLKNFIKKAEKWR